MIRMISTVSCLALATVVSAQAPADAALTKSRAAGAVRASFSKPIELRGGGEPFRGMVYPSPTLYDVDGDGRTELVIGDLRGYVWVSERSADGKSFEEKKQLQVDGKPLKFHNW